MCLGGLTSAASGVAMPLFSLIFGEMIDSFKPTATLDDVLAGAAT